MPLDVHNGAQYLFPAWFRDLEFSQFILVKEIYKYIVRQQHSGRFPARNRFLIS